MKKSNGEIDTRVGKFLYGSLFVLVLPAILAFWAWRLDEWIAWPMPQNLWLMLSLGILGAILLLGGILGILVRGEGLPMNAYPPKKFVSTGVYALFSHPIYLGAVLLSMAFALIFQSSSGLYLISPLIALMITALVLGYERGLIEKQFGATLQIYHPMFSLASSEEKASNWGKTLAQMLFYLPFLLVLYFIDTARGYSLWAIPDWTLLLGLIPFIYLLLRLLLAQTERQLRHFTIANILLMALVSYCYLILPALGINLRILLL